MAGTTFIIIVICWKNKIYFKVKQAVKQTEIIQKIDSYFNISLFSGAYFLKKPSFFIQHHPSFLIGLRTPPAMFGLLLYFFSNYLVHTQNGKLLVSS